MIELNNDIQDTSELMLEIVERCKNKDPELIKVPVEYLLMIRNWYIEQRELLDEETELDTISFVKVFTVFDKYLYYSYSNKSFIISDLFFENTSNYNPRILLNFKNNSNKNTFVNLLIE